MWVQCLVLSTVVSVTNKREDKLFAPPRLLRAIVLKRRQSGQRAIVVLSLCVGASSACSGRWTDERTSRGAADLEQLVALRGRCLSPVRGTDRCLLHAGRCTRNTCQALAHESQRPPRPRAMIKQHSVETGRRQGARRRTNCATRMGFSELSITAWVARNKG